MKKFLSITLTLALTLALFAFPLPASAAVTTESTTNVLFQDDFNSYKGDYTSGAPIRNLMKENGWNDTSTNTQAIYAKTGSYVSPVDISETNMVTSLTDTAEWSNYAVTADISFTDVFVPDETAEEPGIRVNASAVVVLNASELAANGYEVGLSLAEDYTKELVIRHRGVKTLASKLYDFAIDGTVYTVKAEYISGTINCYVNGVLELAYNTSNDEVMLTKGSAGFRKVAPQLPKENGVTVKGGSAEITFDNFKVEKTEKTVWFSENFSYNSADAVAKAGWNNSETIYSNIQNGGFKLANEQTHYTIKSNQTNAWDDYSVESEFVITRTEGTRQYFGVSGRMNGEYGYVFMIQPGSASKNNITARIRKMESGNTNVGAEYTFADGTFVAGATYTLKLEMIGNTINGYINGELVCSGTDDTYTRGSAGYYIASTCTAFNVVADNFKVLGYQPITEYVNETFDNASIEQLENDGWCVNNDEDLSTYINNGKINLPGSGTSAVGIYNTSFNSSNYTTEVDVKVESAPASATTYQVIAAAAGTNQKGGTRVNIGVTTGGAINRIRLQYAPNRTSTVLNSTFDDYTIPNDNRPALGEIMHVSITVRYDETANQSYVKARVVCVASELNYETAEYALPSELEYNGYSGVNANAQGAVSFDNFKAYSVNPYISPIIGDMDGDGVVTATDARYIRSYVLGLSEAAADLNGDTASDIRDLVHFKKVFEFYK